LIYAQQDTNSYMSEEGIKQREATFYWKGEN